MIYKMFSFFAVAEFDNSHPQDADIENDNDFLTNVTRIRRQKVHFGHGSVQHGRDSRGWDRDDRTRDDSYSEEELERSLVGSLDKLHSPPKGKNSDKKSSSTESHRGLDYRGKGLYGESGRDELKAYEAEYQASLNNIGQSQQGYSAKNNHPSDSDKGKKTETVDIDDAYDDGIDLDDTNAEGYDEVGHEDEDHPGAVDRDEIHPFDIHDDGAKNKNSAVEVGKGELISSTQHSKGNLNARNDRHSGRRSTSEKRLASRKKSKRRKFISIFLFLYLYVLFVLDSISLMWLHNLPLFAFLYLNNTTKLCETTFKWKEMYMLVAKYQKYLNIKKLQLNKQHFIVLELE